jgi:two-component system phosphate regulon response regulator PhoB
MPRVLVIEDDPDLRGILRHALADGGYEVRTAGGGLEGLRLAREQAPDLVLLDLVLPDIGGTSVCKQVKLDPATSRARVIIVSGRGEEIDRVVGFELGADDYVVKPFSMRELLLRVRAVMPRERARDDTNVAVCGRLRIDPKGHRVWVEETEVMLPPLQFKWKRSSRSAGSRSSLARVIVGPIPVPLAVGAGST